MGVRSSSLVRLSDGSTLTVRPIHRGDGDLLLEHFAHLGADARYRRFLAPVQDLTAKEVDYFTHPDHRLHEALFALDEDGHPVGVARYISSPEHPQTAEIAVAVVDGWRGRGVGSAIVDELARRARQAGVTRFVAFMLPDNRAMRHILDGLGSVKTLNRDPSSIEVAVELEPS
jgi:RimJ/RimL family protein N-acetyltransferase